MRTSAWSVAGTVGVWAGGVVTAQAVRPAFTAPVRHVEGVRTALAADIGGDGAPDVAWLAGTLVTVVGSADLPDGLWAAPGVSVVLPSEGRAMLAADIDGANGADLIVETAAGVFVARGTGAGGLLAPEFLAPASEFTDRPAFCAADVNGDSRIDLVVVEREVVPGAPGVVRVYTNPGSRPFVAGPVSDGAPGVVSCACADVDGDGAVDVALLSSGLQAFVLRGDGAGVFAPVNAATGGTQAGLAGAAIGAPQSYVTDILLAELNGLAGPAIDLLICGEGPTSVVALPGHGDGRFGPAMNLPSGPNGAARPVLVDANDDGLRDLFAVDPFREEAHVWMANEAGGFLSPRTTVVGVAPTAVFPIRGAGGAFPDMGVTVSWEGFVVGMLNDGAGEVVGAGSVANVVGARGAAAGDMNGDGHADVVVAGALGQARWSLLLNAGDGSGRLLPPIVVTHNETLGKVAHLPSASPISDPHGRVVATLPVAALLVSKHANTGSSTLSVEQSIFLAAPALGVAVGDIDGDGLSDVAASHAGPTTSVSWAIQGGSGVFGPATPIGLGGGGSLLALGDFAGGEGLDAAIGEVDGATVWLALSSGGGFAPGSSVALGGALAALALGDINGDGRADLVTAERVGGDHLLRVRPANGAGGFGAPLSVALGAPALAIGLADMDGDGDLDAAAALDTSESGSDDLVVFRNAAGALEANPASRHAAGAQPLAVLLADLNDSAIGRGSGSAPEAILPNLGTDRVTTLRDIAPAGAPACPGDVNGDGVVDFGDLNAVVSAFNSTSGQPGYNGAADFDNDGDVDFADLNVVLSAYNSAC